MFSRQPLLISTVTACLAVLSGCSVRPGPSTLLRNVAEHLPDGRVIEQPNEKLSDFEKLAGNWAPRQPPADELFVLQADVPDGPGDAGGYMVVYRTGAQAELRYVEQSDHGPRTDRYFQRALAPAEVGALQQFVATHPAATLVRGQAGEEAGGESAGGAIFRFTYARQGLAYAVTMEGVAPDDHPAADLVQLAVRLRDAAPLTCRYLRLVPPAARLLYANPFKAVRQVWAREGEVRAEIYPPIETPPGAVGNPEELHWYVLHDTVWTACDAPPAAAASAPATAPASEPATVPAARISASGLLPTEETWLAEPMNGYTRVRHVIPESAFSARVRTFDVPGLVFDEAHMLVVARRMYLINDGQLFVMDLPDAAFVVR